MVFKFKAKLWLWSGPAAWHFISVPKKESQMIRDFFIERKRGFGSLKVEVKIGKSIWKTSIFPDAKSGQYLLPVKADIRKFENLVVGNDVGVGLKIL